MNESKESIEFDQQSNELSNMYLKPDAEMVVGLQSHVTNQGPKHKIWDVSSAEGSEFSVTQLVAERIDTEGAMPVFQTDFSPDLKDQEKSFIDNQETQEIETRDISVEGEKSEVKLDGEEEETAESREVANVRQFQDSK